MRITSCFWVPKSRGHEKCPLFFVEIFTCLCFMQLFFQIKAYENVRNWNGYTIFEYETQSRARKTVFRFFVFLALKTSEKHNLLSVRQRLLPPEWNGSSEARFPRLWQYAALPLSFFAAPLSGKGRFFCFPAVP